MSYPTCQLCFAPVEVLAVTFDGGGIPRGMVARPCGHVNKGIRFNFTIPGDCDVCDGWHPEGECPATNGSPPPPEGP